MQSFPIVAVETDSDEDSGFNIKFDRPYSIIHERLPVTDDAAIRAIEDAYNWGWNPREMVEGEQVGLLTVTDDGEYIKTELTK